MVYLWVKSCVIPNLALQGEVLTTGHNTNLCTFIYNKDGYRQQNMRKLVHILASPGYAPGTITVNVTWSHGWYCVETAQPIVKLSSLPGSPMILDF